MKAQSVGGGWSGVATGYPLVYTKENYESFLPFQWLCGSL